MGKNKIYGFYQLFQHYNHSARYGGGISAWKRSLKSSCVSWADWLVVSVIIPQSSPIPGNPTTIFYRLVSEPPLFSVRGLYIIIQKEPPSRAIGATVWRFPHSPAESAPTLAMLRKASVDCPLQPELPNPKPHWPTGKIS